MKLNMIKVLMALAGLCIALPVAAQSASQAPTTPQAQASPPDPRGDAFRALDWDRTHAGRVLDLKGYKLAFEDNFDSLSVTREGGNGPWLAPVRSGFGAAKFMPPDPGGPFSVADGVLTIRAEKVAGKWRSGLMQTVDSKGQGFVQQYGYFEMRAQFPDSKGAWPAFWLLSQNGYTDKTKTRTEIDIIEWYGGDPRGHHASVHLWPASQPQPGGPLKHVNKSHYANLKRWDEQFKLKSQPLKDGKLEGWHTYGGEVTPEWVIIYFDGQELARFPTQPENKTPLYMLVDLALFEKEADAATSPMSMKVDYVRVYSKP